MTQEKAKRGASSSSYFWPLLLIGVGLIWLLGNLGIIASANIAALFRMWPLILILIGLDILITHERPQLRALLGLGTVILLLLIALFGPALGLSSGAEVEDYRYTVPIDVAQRSQVTIEASSAPLQIAGLLDSSSLLDAQIRDSSEVTLRVTEGATTAVTLDQRGFPSFFIFGLAGGEDRHWNIGLTDRLPLSLDIDLGSGSAQLDLTRLNLLRVVVEGGSGSVNLQLPPSASGYEVQTEHGSGSWSVELAADASLEWLIEDLGSGSLSVDLPPQLGVRLAVQDDGSGSLSVPDHWQQISGDAEEGVWETENYGSSDYRVLITIQDRGSGSVSLSQG